MRFLFLLGIGLVIQCSSGSSGSITQCSQVMRFNKCDYQQYGDEHCAWQNNQCVQIKQCSDITTRQVCDGSPAPFAGCVWDPVQNRCFKPDPGTCLAIKDLTTCNDNPACVWSTASNECQLISKCADVSNQSKCNNLNLENQMCFWSVIAPTACDQAQSCGDLTKSGLESECARRTVNSQYCKWTVSSGVCSQMRECSDATLQSDCDYVAQKLGCDWDAGASICKDDCTQIQTKSLCTASSPKCGWDGTHCVQAVCQVKSDLPSCKTETSQTDCENAGCTWQPDCGSATSQGACGGLGSDCQWKGVTCSSLSESQCVAGCSWCNSQSGSSATSCSLGCSAYDCGGLVANVQTCQTATNGFCKVYSGPVCASTVNGDGTFACYGGCVGTSTQGTCTNILKPLCIDPGSNAGRNNCTSHVTQTSCPQSYCQWGAKVGG